MAHFHCCPLPLGNGSVILPGNWGRTIQKMGYRHQFFGREMLLENSRIALLENAPSRLSCVFAVPTEDAIREYRDREIKPTEYLYEIEPIDKPVIYAAPLNVFGANISDQERATVYWQAARIYDGNPSSLPAFMPIPMWWELLIDGPVRIIRMLDEVNALPQSGHTAS